MSYYYKYNFVSPEPIFAEVKEELDSYFQTGVINDLMFSKYTERCLAKLGRSSYKITETILNLEDFSAKLPDDFTAVRELWLCTPQSYEYTDPSATYEQATCRITPIRDKCNECEVCPPNELKITYKTTGKIIQHYTVSSLLTPGNVNAKDNCSMDSLNKYSNSSMSFDIQNNRVYTNFPVGELYLVYYAKEYDENDYQLIPDNERIKEYLMAFLKFKCFEKIFNSSSDESFNQNRFKFELYQQAMWDAKTMAELEIKKQTTEQMIHGLNRQRARHNKYRIT